METVPTNPENAALEQTIAELAEYFLQTATFLVNDAPFQIHSLADVLLFGVALLREIAPLYKSCDSATRKLLDEVYAILLNPERSALLREYMRQKIDAGAENAAILERTAQNMPHYFSRPADFRRTALQAVKMLLPAGTSGRMRKLGETDFPKLAKFSDLLWPVMRQILDWRAKNSKRSLPEMLEFLAADHSDACKYLLSVLPEFEVVLKNRKLLALTKTPPAQARIFADVMAGWAFQLKPSYAIEKAREARRRAKRQPGAREN